MNGIKKVIVLLLVTVLMLSDSLDLFKDTEIKAAEDNSTEKRITFKLKKINGGTGVKIVIGKSSGSRCYFIKITKRKNEYDKYSNNNFGYCGEQIDNIYTDKTGTCSYVINGLPEGKYTFQIGGYRYGSYYFEEYDEESDFISIPESKKKSITIKAPKEVKKVTKTQDFSKAQKGDVIKLGSYEQDDNMQNGKEDIEWIVLEKYADRIFVVSKYALDCLPYYKNPKDGEYLWENSTIREWLNKEFYKKAFTENEKSMISETTITNEYGEDSSKNGEYMTNDRVFLLSSDEVEETGLELMCFPTEYSVIQGAYQTESFGEWPDNPRWDYYSPCVSWMLRDTGGLVVKRPCSFDYEGTYYISDQKSISLHYAIRPAMMVKIQSKSYSNDEICAAALKCYEELYGQKPPYISVDGENDNQLTLKLYDISLGHTNTWEWFTIDRKTGKGSSMFSGDIDLTPYLK